MKHDAFLAGLNRESIVSAIQSAEGSTSGEIRIHIQPKATGGELRWVAERTFERLGMTKTAGRTGVLLFITSEEQRFVILGDRGINEKVPVNFWDDIATKLTERFKAGQFTEGIVEAVISVGEKLRSSFPRATDDVDELSNEISLGSDTDPQ